MRKEVGGTPKKSDSRRFLTFFGKFYHVNKVFLAFVWIIAFGRQISIVKTIKIRSNFGEEFEGCI